MPSMRIVIDGRMLYWTGVGRYTRRLLENLERLDSTNQYLVLIRSADWDMWEPSQPNFVKVKTDINPYTVGEQTTLVGTIRALKPDLVHFLAPNAPVMYRGKRITTIHDLTLLDFDTSRGSGIKRQLRGLKRIPFRFVLGRSARGSDQVLAVTQYVANQVVSRLGAEKGKVHVTMLGSEPNMAEAEPLDRLSVPDDFLFYYGTYYPYKNIASTIRALHELSDRFPRLGLVLAGSPDAYGDELKHLAKKLGVDDRVRFVGFVSDGVLVSLCRAATIFVFPSLSEGFGLPGLEAMAQGLPVLAAKASCLPEVYGDAAEYFDPYSPIGQVRQITRLLEDKELRANLEHKGKAQAQKYSWETTAKLTLDSYEQVLAERDA